MTPCSRISATARTGVELREQDAAQPAGETDAERDVEPEDVEEGQRREADVLGGHLQPGVALDLADVRLEVPVREHRGTRRARRAGREEQHRELRLVALGLDRHRFRLRQLRGTDRTGQLEQVLGAGAAHHDPGPDAGHLDRVGGHGRARVDGHGDRAGPERAEVRADEVGVVPARDRDPVARLHPERGEAPGRERGDRFEVAEA